MKPNQNVLLVCTPIENIKEVKSRLSKLFKIIYLPDIEYEDFKNNTFHEVKGIFTNPNRSKIFLSCNVFNELPNLEFICTASTGTVHIDVTECNKRDIKIISLKDETDFLAKVSSTAELAFTLMMSAIRKITPSVHDVYEGNWDCDKFIGKQLCDLKVGVLGMGRLGKIFASYCNAFNSEVYFFDPYVSSNMCPDSKKFEKISEFLSELDVLSIHIHATKDNKEYINKKILDLCKKDIVIINTSRGEVVNEADIINHLKKNKHSIYATDVITDEIDSKDNSPIYKYFYENYPLGNIIITPHIGGMSEGARFLAYNKSIDLLESYLMEESKNA